MKLLKALVITGGICCLLGVGTMVLGGLMGGSFSIYQLPQRVGYMKDIIWEGNGQEERQSFSEVRTLKIEVHADAVELVEEQRADPKDQSIQVVWENGESKKTYQCIQEDDTLRIERRMRPRVFKDRIPTGQVVILVPEGYQFDRVEVEGKAGSFYASKLSCGSLELEADASEICVDAGMVGALDVSCRAGSVEVLTAVTGDIDVECKTGSVLIHAVGPETDYNYDLTCTAGSIDLAGTNYSRSGFSWEREMDNQAEKQMDLDCAAGSITIEYENKE